MQVVHGFLFAAACAASASLAINLTHKPSDRCALPDGVTSVDTTVALRAMACRDLESGRISAKDYRAMIGLDVPAPPSLPMIVEPPVVVQPEMPAIDIALPDAQWASSVRAVSSEWSATSWNAQKVLGVPDVYPQHGDIANAWASRQPDNATEFIEVGFANPTTAMGVTIVETFNPGAIQSVELITTSGKHVMVPTGRFAPGTGSQIRNVVTSQCTSEPIAAARITLNSGAVPGWNEIDAIGLVGCQ